MPRRVQDILPGDKRSIRDSGDGQHDNSEKNSRKKPSSSETKSSKKRDDSDESVIKIHKLDSGSAKRQNLEQTEELRNKPPRHSKKWLLVTLGVVAVIAIFAFIASTRYSRASFVITPKVIPLDINGTYVAQGSPAKGVLSYELVTIKAAASTTVPAKDGKTTSTKARGIVSVYNTYSEQPVRLIAGSRISNDSGLVYRLANSIVVPGYTKPQGTLVPGKINVEVIADQAGANYNIGKNDAISDFKFIGYKGTPKYDSVFARLSGDIAGGYSGVKKIVDSVLLASTTEKLKMSLTSNLQSKLKSSIPEDYVYLENGYSVTFSSPTVESAATKDLAIISEQGTIYGVIMKKKDLVSKLSVGQSDSNFGTFGYIMPDLNEIQMSFTNMKDFSPTKKTPLVFKAKGKADLVAQVPVEEIRKKLQGNSLSVTQDIFKSYSPVIESGTGELVPPWAKIPNDPKRINITIEK